METKKILKKQKKAEDKLKERERKAAIQDEIIDEDEINQVKEVAVERRERAASTNSVERRTRRESNVSEGSTTRQATSSSVPVEEKK